MFELLILLAASVLGAEMDTNVTEKEIEGDPAVISCFYTVGYKTFPKSICKKINEECKMLLKTDSKNDWKLEGKWSLHDNRDKNMFVVTINNVSLEDQGRYGCGVMIPELHLFNVVHLSVIKGKSALAVTHKPGSMTDSTGSSTQPTASQSLSGFVRNSFYVGAFFVVVMLLSAIFCVFKHRVMKSSAGTTPTENIMDVCVYDEIQHSNPAEQNASETPDVPLGPDSYPACITEYSLLTNPKESTDLTDIFPTNRESCLAGEINDPAENLTEPKYCCVEFPNARDVRLSRGCNDEYSTVSNRSPIYTSIVAPKRLNSD